MSSFKYYVFISYSRKDSRAAAYLHRQLECFRIPMRLVPQGLLENGQKYLRPVFRDRRDLNNSERSFTNDIKTAIEAARYLLVLCSPNSASSHWVNEEVHHFIEYHGGDCSNVVPVILNGSPGSGKVDECLPPALRIPEVIGRNLPSMLPDYGEPEKYGW